MLRSLESLMFFFFFKASYPSPFFGALCRDTQVCYIYLRPCCKWQHVWLTMLFTKNWRGSYFTCFWLKLKPAADKLVFDPQGSFLFQYDFMSFSTKSHSVWLSRPWVSHWGSADSEAVASVVQMMALLLRAGVPVQPLHTACLFSHIAVFVSGLQSETSYDISVLPLRASPYKNKI